MKLSKYLSDSLPDILNTTAMRMAIRYSLLYTLLLSLVLAAFLWSTSRRIDEEIKEALDAERQMLSALYHQQGVSKLVTQIEALQKQPDSFLYLLVNTEAKKLAGNLKSLPEDFEQSLEHTSEAEIVFFDEDILLGFLDDDAYLPTLSTNLDNHLLLIAHLSPQAQVLQEVYEYLLEFIGVAILLSLLIGMTLGYAVLRRINTISHTAAEIMKGDITQRIPISSNDDEFDDLSTQLNSMMDRIQKLIDSIREVSDNVAHDLRSPLTRLRNNFEITLLEKRSPEEYRESLNKGVQDIEYLITTFNALLSIAQAESGNHRSQWQSIDVTPLLTDIVDLYEPLAEKKKQVLIIKEGHLLEDRKIEIIASKNLLAQAFSNLIENAIKYSPETEEIIIAINNNKDLLEISFIDSGQGIPVNEREHVLERFVRLDNSRNSPGNGLGLSLVSAVCELHNGRFVLSDAEPGLIATMQLPLH